MKKSYTSIKLVCLLIYISFLGMSSYGQQCGNGTPAQAMSYQIGFVGGGNNHYDADLPQFDTSRTYFSFPQFEPSKGTLIQVEIQTIINVTNTYKIENNDVSVALPKVKIFRSDMITSPAFSAPYEANTNKTIASLSLKASDGVTGSGQDYKEGGPVRTYDNYPINYNITSNLAGFLGTGNVNFQYDTETNLSSSWSNTTFTSTTTDSVTFKLIYYYCTTSILPADISNFTAIKLASGMLQLTWKSSNDNIGNKYEMQKSTDGENYTSFQTFLSKSNAANNYQVNYNATREDKNKVFFRIKQYEADGSIKYSLVKAIDLDYTATTMKVYPTVTRNSVNIYFPYAAKSDYQVNIVSITGQDMQRLTFSKTNFIKVALNSSLKPGIYVVRVINKQTLETQQSKMIIE